MNLILRLKKMLTGVDGSPRYGAGLLCIFWVIYLVLTVTAPFYYSDSINCTITDTKSSLPGDQGFYDKVGDTIAKGKGYTINGKPICTYQMGYPLFVGFLYKILGHNFKIVIILQLIMIWIGFIIFSRLSLKLNKKLFFVPLLFFMGNYLILFYTCMLLTECLALILVIISFFLLYQIIQSPRVWMIILLGLLVGYLALVRPQFEAFPFLMLIVAALSLFKRKFKLFKHIIIFFLASIIVFGPVLLRNHKEFGFYRLSLSGGIAFLIGTNPAHDGEYTEFPVIVKDLNLKDYEKMDLGDTSADKVKQIDDYLFNKGLENFKKKPLTVLSIMCKNVTRLIFGFPHKTREQSLPRTLLMVLNILAFISMLIGLYLFISKRLDCDSKTRTFLIFCYSFIFCYIALSCFFWSDLRYGIYPVIMIYLVSPVAFHIRKTTNKHN
ncbi:MAG: hypothetical protein ACM3SY_04040 [Candidatus Omnitrophota bacterium]